jgi:hypothetical protein
MRARLIRALDLFNMKLAGITYEGRKITDEGILNDLPADYRSMLKQINGFILYGGGLHVRGACKSPKWHSLRNVWTGSFALHKHYSALLESDVPFAQDCVGDQFILRDHRVHRLDAETGRLESMEVDLKEFLKRTQKNSVEYLSLYPLLRYQIEGNSLKPGQLLNVYPPFCFEESSKGVSIKAIAMFDRLGFLADLSKQIAELPEGGRIEIKVTGDEV